MNCLLIDDDLDDQEIFCIALRDVNPDIQCMLAKDGYEGIEKLKLLEGQVHDFIFIDLSMPGLSGIETLQEIKKLQFLNDSKIIIYSSSSTDKIIAQAMKAGADDFLVKPASIPQLIMELTKIVGSPSL